MSHTIATFVKIPEKITHFAAYSCLTDAAKAHMHIGDSRCDSAESVTCIG